jgi:predicted helicase
MKQYFKDDTSGETDEGPDPVIHFYEDFLKEYDPELRKKMGAFYTPLPVVRFIVRSVDYLLEKDFGLTSGLADTSKTATGIHRVQVLDPAVGTGTFISAAIRIIYERLLKGGQKGRWHTYVHNDLLPRLHGFELMMAPYTIAHLKLSMAFKETGFKYFNRRLGIYLTNSLEESVTKEDLFSGFGFAESIADESKEASVIKNESPIMVVIGNPPYSVSSSNKGEWILNLIKDYKKNLNERKINLDDDYIKFIRFAEHFIEKNKSGIVAMITNNSFIDGITHRQMRKHLLETFDDIYILDLHGNSKKKEKSPSGDKDENVFDIQQGVAISIFVRKAGEKKMLASVRHAELYGIREEKFKTLARSNLQSIKWKKLDYSEPYYYFVPKDFRLEDQYKKGFNLNELLSTNSSGVETQNDSVNIFFDQKNATLVFNNFLNFNEKELRTQYGLKDGRDWKVRSAKSDLVNNKILTNQIQYRPFDVRFTNYTGVTKGNMAYPRFEVMKNFVKKNIGIIFKRGFDEEKSEPIFLSKCIIDRRSWSRPGMQGAEVIAPLYVYLEDGSKIPNLKKEIVKEIEKIVGKVTPEDIFDYIYAVLHSPSYREKYKEFLKIDFPRVPYPKDAKSFKKLVALGAELRLLHLLESPKVNKFITTYPVSGSDTVEKLVYKDGPSTGSTSSPQASSGKGNVYINKDQCFGNVPESAWNFYIGGYQPAQKWLKDRKGRTLTNADIEHYQKIIVALVETERIMREIDKGKLIV